MNGCVLYCLARHYQPIFSFETGVSGGYYTTFLLAALQKHAGCLVSVELSDDLSKVATLVPKEWKTLSTWHLQTGTDSVKYMKEHPSEIFEGARLYCHDSLHTMSHMLKELNEFKRCKMNDFIVFIDDEKSDNFWHRCLQMKAFQKPGYSVKYISGAESRLQGHLGGFLRYVKD